MTVLKRLRTKFPVLTPPKVKAEARVAIAQDVIANLDAGRMTAEKGTYFRLGEVYPGVDDTFESVALAIKQPRGKTTCKVCAIGAACVSAVGLYDEAPEAEEDWDRSTVDDETMRDVLTRYFSRDQIGLIECAFEWSNAFATHKNRPRVKRAVEYGIEIRREAMKRLGIFAGFLKHIPEVDEASLRGIMHNVIDNGGTFKP